MDDAGPCSPVPAGFRVVRVNVSAYNTRPMVVRAGRDWLSLMLRRHGHWEVRQPDDVLRGMAPGTTLPRAPATFLDIGANLGFFSLMFAARGDRVIAVEPMSSNRRALEATLCRNPDLASRVIIVATALGARERSGSCVVRSHATQNLGNGLLECGDGEAYTCRTLKPPSREMLTREGLPQPLTVDSWRRLPCEEVSVTTIDAVLRRLAPHAIDFVKMDIEGHECAALQGATALFTTYKPRFLLTEWKQRHVAKCWRELARTHHYRTGAQWGTDRNVGLMLEYSVR